MAHINEATNIFEAGGIVENIITKNGFECGISFIELRESGLPIDITLQNEIAMEFMRFQTAISHKIKKSVLANTRFAKCELFKKL